MPENHDRGVSGGGHPRWAAVLAGLLAEANGAGASGAEGSSAGGSSAEGSPAEGSPAEGGSGRRPGVPWSPPAGLGPLPAELRVEALRVIRAQAAAVEYFEGRRDTAARQLAAVLGVPAAPRASVYLDTTG